ncbi:MAG: universal stress protein [Gammaproteobacteria bacterium]
MAAPLIHAEGRVLAAVDASVYAESVARHAAWAATRLQSPLQFLHVLDRHPETAPVADLSGNLALGARETLLLELAEVDAQRSRLAQERGRALLDEVRRLAGEQGATDASGLLRHGGLVDTLVELEPEVRLFVLGKRGEHADFARGHLGGDLERVVRAVHRPLLVASRAFRPIARIAIAFDGSATTRKGVAMVAASPLFRGLPCDVVMAGRDDGAAREQLAWAQDTLADAGFTVETVLAAGDAEKVISAHVAEAGIDLLVMGAYGHSRIRTLIVGSTTTAMLRSCRIPVLLLR